jgi:hypothetical protein
MMPYTKPALDAIADQSLAAIREHRGEYDPESLRVAGDIAAVLAEQFPDDRVTAGRAIICAVQIAASLGDQLKGDGTDPGTVVDLLTDVLALAAEQVVREAGAA